MSGLEKSEPINGTVGYRYLTGHAIRRRWLPRSPLETEIHERGVPHVRSPRCLLPASIAVVLVVAGCGADERATPADVATETVKSTAPTRSPVSASAESTVAQVSVDKESRYSSSLVIDCPQHVDSESDQQSAEIPSPSLFDWRTGQFVKVARPEIPAKAQLVQVGCLPSGTLDNPTVTYRLSLRTPAEGLSPEKYETRIETYSTDTSAEPVTATLDLPTDQATKYSMMVPTGGNLLVAARDGKDFSLIRPNGDRVATYPTEWNAVRYVDSNVFIIATEKVGSDPFATMYDGATGQRLTFDQGVTTLTSRSSIKSISADGFSYYLDDYPTYTYFYVDTKTKKSHKLGSWQAGGVPDVAVWGKYAYAAGGGLSVTDLDTGKTLISRTKEEWDGLGVKHWYAAGPYLYLENEDDSPVIDVTTGKTVSRGWSRRPTNILGDEWTLVLPSPVTNDYVQCYMNRYTTPSVMWGFYSLDDAYGCYETGKLVHTPDGYQGPWF